MPGASGLATTFNSPNYVGPFFWITPTDTPFSTIIGSLTDGGDVVDAQDFAWQFSDLRAAGPRPAKENANAPTAETRVRAQASNVVMAVHETVGVSYRRQATPGSLAGVNVHGRNPFVNEFGFQMGARMQEMKLDFEWNMLRSRYHKAASTSEENTTRGALPAIQTNRVSGHGVAPTNGGAFSVTEADPGVFTTTGGAHGLEVGDQIQFVEGEGVLPTAVHSSGLEFRLEEARTYYIVVQGGAATFQISDTPGGAPLEITDDGAGHATRLVAECIQPTTEIIDSTLQQVYDNGGIQIDETRVLMCSSHLKRVLSFLYVTNKGYEEKTRHLGGVAVERITTDFGDLNVVVNRHMPDGSLAIFSMEEFEPKWLATDKGLLFSEELGKRGSQTEFQIYGEYGLEYGNQRKHALITHLKNAGAIA